MASIRFFQASGKALHPLDALRPVESLHFGVRSIANQWHEALLSKPTSIALHPQLLPTDEAVAVIQNMPDDATWNWEGICLAQTGQGQTVAHDGTPQNAWLADAAQLFECAGAGLKADLPRLRGAWRLRPLQEEERDSWLTKGIVVHGPMDHVLVGPGAILRDASLNTEQGPVVLGPDSEVMEGCRIRGPFALGEGSVLRMGSKVYGPTTVGQGCKVGGELSNVVIHDWSNKAHGGFLGNAVLGSWCNLGAETTCSNLKNTYGEIAEWDEGRRAFETKGRTFCGLLMGDHSKTGIHTAFSTATVVGAMCNVFGDATPLRNLPSFSWGGQNEQVHDLERALQTAKKVMARRNQAMDAETEARIREVFAFTRG